MKIRLLALGLLLAGALAAAPGPLAAQPGATPVAQPSPSPATKPSPSPTPRQSLATPTPSALADLFSGPTGNQILVVVGAVLIIIASVAWVLSNRAERKPSVEQLEQIREFVEGDFARHVAEGLAARDPALGALGAPGVPEAEPTSVAQDPAWRKAFVHQLGLHNEFYLLGKAEALEIYTTHIDAAVKRRYAALQEESAKA